jgi:multidrug efflux pump subunit AcrA (membrane-fusion protein)
MKITKEALKQIVMEELRTTLTEQATNLVGMPVEPDIQNMDARAKKIAQVQQQRERAQAEREAKATKKAAAAQELEKKKAADKSMEQAALSAMAALGAEKALAAAEKALNDLSLIIAEATEGDNDSEIYGRDLYRRAGDPKLSTRSGNVVDIKKYTLVGSNTSKSITELAKVLDNMRIMVIESRKNIRAAKKAAQVSSGATPPR